MHSAFFKGTRSRVAVKTFAIVVRLVELDIGGFGRMAEVILVDVAEASDFRLDGAEQSVRFVIDTGRKEQGSCGTSTGAVTKSQRPQSVDLDRLTVAIS